MTDKAQQFDQSHLPSSVTTERGLFDRMADKVTEVISRSHFFAFCFMSVIIWAVWGPFIGFSETWQLIINTGTTIITFLMVALLENSTRRADMAIQHKLNAVTYFLSKPKPTAEDRKELRIAVGIEDWESTT